MIYRHFIKIAMSPERNAARMNPSNKSIQLPGFLKRVGRGISHIGSGARRVAGTAANVVKGGAEALRTPKGASTSSSPAAEAAPSTSSAPKKSSGDAGFSSLVTPRNMAIAGGLGMAGMAAAAHFRYKKRKREEEEAAQRAARAHARHS